MESLTDLRNMRLNQTVPFATPSGIDQTLLGQLRAGIQAVHAEHVLVKVAHSAEARRITPESLTMAGLAEAAIHTDGTVPVLFVTPEFDSALLVTDVAYSLLTGGSEFLRGAVPQGIDAARVAFARDSRKLSARHPQLTEIARRFPPIYHSWARPGEVAAQSAIAEMLSLMDQIVCGELPATEFARHWFPAYYRHIRQGERVREDFLRLLNDVLYLVDEKFSIDPSLRDPDDVTDQELVAAVNTIRAQLGSL
jgi:hypothetical protein